MIIDEKLVNTIKLISLKNALDFNNNIKFDVVISKIFPYSKDTKNDIKDLIPEIKKIISELSLLSFNEKKILYDQILNTANHYQSGGGSGSRVVLFMVKISPKTLLTKMTKIEHLKKYILIINPLNFLN